MHPTALRVVLLTAALPPGAAAASLEGLFYVGEVKLSDGDGQPLHPHRRREDRGRDR